MAEENKNKYIFNVSDATKEAIARKSAQFLPDNPSARGMTADQIRKALYAPVTDAAASVLAELDLVIDAVDAAIVAEEDARIAAINDANNAINAEKTAREEALKNKVNNSALSVGADRDSVALRDLQGRLYTKEPDDNMEGSGTKTRGNQAVNLSYLEGLLSRDVTPRLDALATAVSGKARSYVFETLNELATAINGTGAFDCSAFRTGDNMLIIQKDVPDFWFEATGEDDPREPTYTYEDAEGNRTEYSLIVYNYDDNNTKRVGLLHILESDYTVIEGYSKAASRSAQEAAESAAEARENANLVYEAVGDVGDIEAALDAILAMQAKLIGGRA